MSDDQHDHIPWAGFILGGLAGYTALKVGEGVGKVAKGLVTNNPLTRTKQASLARIEQLLQNSPPVSNPTQRNVVDVTFREVPDQPKESNLNRNDSYIFRNLKK